MTDVKIEGLKQFTKGLKSLDKDLGKAVRLSFNAAADLIVDDARPRVPKGPTGRARASVKAASTQTKARVKGGGNKAPHYPWLDFGGRVGKNRSIKRPFLKEGRYIYRSFYKNRHEFIDIMQRELIKVAKSAGIEVDKNG